jgi:hypothetical protein
MRPLVVVSPAEVFEAYLRLQEAEWSVPITWVTIDTGDMDTGRSNVETK